MFHGLGGTHQQQMSILVGWHPVPGGVLHDQVVKPIAVNVAKEIDWQDVAGALLTVDRADFDEFDKIAVLDAVAQHAPGLDEQQCIVVTQATHIVGDQVAAGVQGDQRVDRQVLLMGFVTPGDQNFPAAVSMEIGHKYSLLDAETGIDYKLVEVLAGGNAAGKYEKTE